MLQYTADEILFELNLTRADFPADALMLLEGPTDFALLQEYKHSGCRLFVTGNKEKSLQVIDLIEDEGALQGVAAIVDQDCWVVTGSHWLGNPHVLYDDTPDMETMVFESNALEKYLRNAMTGKGYRQVTSFAESLRNHAAAIGSEFGYFRTVQCLQPALGLMLSALEEDIGECIDKNTLRIKRGAVAARLTEDTTSTNSQQLREDVDRITLEYSSAAYCRGKDILSITVHIFDTVFRQSFADEDLLQNLESELAPRPRSALFTTLFERLRSAFEFTHFLATALYRRIRDWEASHTPFRIIRDYPSEGTPA